MAHSPIEIIQFMTRNNLRDYKVKGSRMAFTSQKATGISKNKSSVVFASESKDNLSEGQSLVITSYETLQERTDDFTHWTPNTFCYGTYSDFKNRRAIGHEKENLRQVSVFGVDIDTKAIDLYEVLENCSIAGFPYPNVIVETTKGYQLSFVLGTPFFIHKNEDYKALRIAERISTNIRDLLSGFVPVDTGCNHFGFFRIPRTDNVRYFHDEPINTQWLIDWSRTYSKEQRKKAFHVVTSADTSKQIETEWYKALVGSTSIQRGIQNASRNNVVLSLALANYQSGVPEDEAYDVLDQFNSNLDDPLKDKEVSTILRSAYKGKYRGACRDYIEPMLDLWASDTEYKATKTGWYKFAKPREERQRSHYDEWENDVLEYLESVTDIENPYMEVSERQLANTLNMPHRSLQEVFKKSSKLVRHVQGRGRGSRTILASRQILVRSFLRNRKKFIEHTQKTFLIGVIDQAQHVENLIAVFPFQIHQILKRFFILGNHAPPISLII